MHQSFSHLTQGYLPNEKVSLKLAILGAPGSGKSTLSSGLLYFSKLFFFKVDCVPEVAKWHYYKKANFQSPDFELEKFQEQKSLEDIYPSELDILICEAPLVISAIYAAYYYGDDSEIAKKMLDLAEQHKERYGHFIVSRKLVKFEDFGRNENEKQAEEIHFKTLEILEKLNLNYIVINRLDEHIPLQILSMLGAISKKNETTKKVHLKPRNLMEKVQSEKSMRPTNSIKELKEKHPLIPAFKEEPTIKEEFFCDDIIEEENFEVYKNDKSEESSLSSFLKSF